MPFVQCKCHFGSAKAQAVFIADILIGFRAVFGIIRRDSSKTCLIYAVLYIVLIIVAPALARLAGGH